MWKKPVLKPLNITNHTKNRTYFLHKTASAERNFSDCGLLFGGKIITINFPTPITVLFTSSHRNVPQETQSLSHNEQDDLPELIL